MEADNFYRKWCAARYFRFESHSILLWTRKKKLKFLLPNIGWNHFKITYELRENISEKWQRSKDKINNKCLSLSLNQTAHVVFNWFVSFVSLSDCWCFFLLLFSSLVLFINQLCEHWICYIFRCDTFSLFMIIIIISHFHHFFFSFP